ncbi:YhdP family protein [Sneathiella aquimaris]|uniref:YhdP family protein n=1 Tax=Sneathiella aquimaris TaxID=2599305 RepID=UPI00146AE6BF|nr:AsmA-like C-terminal domain-containing protein [Sneathiella aquimaris]
MIKASAKILTRTFLSVLVLLALVVFLLVGALSYGPISFSFAAPYINQLLASQYPDMEFGFSDLQLLWDSEDKDLVFGVNNVSIKRNDEPIAQIPAVTVTFSGEALVKGRIAPSGLEFSGLKVLLTREESGAIRLGYSYDEERSNKAVSIDQQDQASLLVIHDLLNSLGTRKSSSDLTAYLERLEIYQSGLFIEDEKLNKLWRVTSANMVIWRTEEGLTGRLQGDAHIGDESINLIANAAYSRDRFTTVVNTRITDFPPSILAKEIPELDILKGISLPVSGDINISFDPAFTPQQVGFKLETGEGQVDIPSLYTAPLNIQSVRAEGHTAAPFDAINLNSAIIEAKGRGPTITMSGSFVNDAENGLGMSIEGSLPKLYADDLPVYWPYSAAVDAYKWVTAKIKDGIVHNTTFRMDLPAGAMKEGIIPDGAIELKFSFEKASADYFAPLPKVTDVSGNVVLTEKQIHITDLSGTLLDMDLPSGNVLIYDFEKKNQTADIRLQVKGQSKSIFEFLDRKPLELVTDYGIVPDKMQGEGVVDARFVFPLLDNLTLEKVVYEASGSFKDAYIPNVFQDINLGDGDLDVTVSTEEINVSGPAKLNGNPAQILFQAYLRGKKKGVRRYEVQAKLDETARQSLGADLDFIKGSAGASLAVDVQPSGKATGVVTLNLLETDISFDALHIHKPIGVTGLLGLQFATDGTGKTDLSNVRLSADQLELVGKGSFDQDGLSSFAVDRLIVGESDLALNVNRVAANEYALNVSGPVLDLRPFVLKEKVAEADGISEKTEDVADEKALIWNSNIKIGTALLAGGVALKNLSGQLSAKNDVIQKGDIAARFTDEFGISFALRENKNGRQFEFQSDHAGLLLRGLDVYDNARDGTLEVSGMINDTGENSRTTGVMSMKEVRIVKAPVLGKILTLGSLGGIVELLQNDGMTFTTVEGPFVFQDDELSTKDFRAVGSIGITFTGSIDQKQKTIDGFGTVIPSYTLNSILGNIPILGRLLVGREGEGIFGFSYKVKGGSDNPDISVNPVSALAPGILRRMFFEPWGKDAEAPTVVTPEGQEIREEEGKP